MVLNVLNNINIHFMKNLSLILVFALISAMGMTQTINKTDSQGRKIGKWQKKYKNGQLRYKGQFENGYETGQFIYYYPSGKIQSKINFTEKGTLAAMKSFYENGVQKATGFYRNKKKHGTWKYYSPETGNLVSEESYSNGIKDGVWIVYYPSGKVASKVVWENGLRNGEWKEFFENGQLKLSATFVDGKMAGAYTTYYLGNKISRKGQYVDGKMDGIWIGFDINGLKNSYQKYDKGFLEVEKKYENGKQVYLMDNINNKFIDNRKKDDGGEK